MGFFKKKEKPTHSAIESRVRRALEKKGFKLRKSRSAEVKEDSQEYYVIDTKGESLPRTHCNLYDLAKELKVL